MSSPGSLRFKHKDTRKGVFMLCPHGDSNPGFDLERVASWAPRRWGRHTHTERSRSASGRDFIIAPCNGQAFTLCRTIRQTPSWIPAYTAVQKVYLRM